MTLEDKELLLKDVCSRLPYGTKVKCHFDSEPYTLLSINWNKEIVVVGFMMVDTYVTSKQMLVNIKPYLRPMSSMTDEEKEEFKNKFKGFFQYFNGSIISDNRIYDRNEAVFVGEESCGELIDWLNKKMFDFRRLIPKDLALSTDKFDPYKK